MANYYKLGQTVTTENTILTTLRAFLIAAAPGPGWVEDATFLNAGNAGKLFMRTAGATSMYVFFDDGSWGGQTVLQCYWVPGVGHGYGGGLGALLHHSAPGCFFFLRAGYTHALDMFADENRCVAVLRSTVTAGAPPAAAGLPETITQVLYFGGYTSHADAADDTYPLMVAGNSLYTVTTVPTDSEYGFFPESLAKRVGPNENLFLRQRDAGVWTVARDHTFVPPRNSRGGEAFAYQQEVYVAHPGAEESFTLTGLALSTRDHGLLQDVTISAADYYSVPSLLHTNPSVTGSYGAVLLIPKGTIVP